jgi:hypothetical protein
MIFGLSTARVGATLAVVLVGYNILIGETATGEPIRLLNESVLNGTILMILVTCTISSFIVEKASQQLALQNENQPTGVNDQEKVLISLAYPETVADLVDLGLLLKPKKSPSPVYALHIVSDEHGEEGSHSIGKKMMDKAVAQATATEQVILPLTRHDANISNGIIYTIKEQGISDLIIGLHHNAGQKDFLGETAERILRRVYETIFIYQPVQPMNTLKRMVVLIPPKAELEPGFSHWFYKLSNIAKESGLAVTFYGTSTVLKEIEDLQVISNLSIKTTFQEFPNWDDFLILSREVKQDDLFVIVASRKGHFSYNAVQDKLPYYLTNYFRDNSFILLFPKQLELGLKRDDVQYADGALAETIVEGVSNVNKVGGLLKKMFGKKKED